MNTVERRIVTGYIISSDQKLLLGRKPPGSGAVYADCWHNPGGGVDGAESDQQALKREIFEETGLDITEADVVRIDSKGRGQSVKTLPSGEQVLVNMQFNVYKIILAEPADKIKVTATDDLVGFQWFPVDTLDDVQLTPPAKELLMRIGKAWLRTR